MLRVSAVEKKYPRKGILGIEARRAAGRITGLNGEEAVRRVVLLNVYSVRMNVGKDGNRMK